MKPRWSRKRLRYLNTLALFLTPALLFYALFIVFPLVQSLVFGFFKVDILGGEPTYQFVGWGQLPRRHRRRGVLAVRAKYPDVGAGLALLRDPQSARRWRSTCSAAPD